jgi:adenylate kinase
MERVKKPHNYGLTAEEEEIAKQKELLEKEKHEREEREERERDEQEAANDRRKKEKDWTTKLDQVKREQHEILDTQSLPLRNYLMTHVMPTLTKALIGTESNIPLKLIRFFFLFIECCKVQPEDPVDFVVC